MDNDTMSKKIIRIIQNAIHIILILFVFLMVFHAIFRADESLSSDGFFKEIYNGLLKGGLNEWFSFIGALGIILFGITGFYEYAYKNGVSFLVPPMYIEITKRSMVSQTEKMMELYYNEDLDFIKTYEEERTAAILSALGLTAKQFHAIRYEILRARSEPINNMWSLKRQASQIFLNSEFLIDLTTVDTKDRVYADVDYYIDLYTAFFDTDICQDACRIMCNYLYFCLGEDMEHIDYFIIPYGGNLLLGLAVGRQLKIPVIAIRENSRVVKNRCWDGNYGRPINGRKNKVVILHDVLVSAERIYKSLECLPEGSYELLAFCHLIYYRTEKKTIESLDQHGIQKGRIHSLLEVTGSEIKKKIKNDEPGKKDRLKRWLNKKS